MKIAITGATGNMGQEAVAQLLKNQKIELLRLLVLPDDKRGKALLKKHKKDKNRLQIVWGNIADSQAVQKLIDGCEYVVNMAAVIPPLSDKKPEKAIECNQIGVQNLISTIKKVNPSIKLIHISTVALYGNRNSRHPWARIGDPLLVSPFDIYSASKLRGEFAVLESELENWVVLRQTAMLHKRMLSDNIHDGLMFHTCFNAPLEWVTAHDSGVLIANIIKKDSESPVQNFWKRCFNIGGGLKNQLTGYDTLNDGFKLIGGSTKDFFKPYFNAIRNFHGVWFADYDELDKLFGYISQDTTDYWREIGRTHKYYAMAKIMPKGLISKLVIQRLFKDDNSPAYWFAHNDEPRLVAYFGGRYEYLKLKNIEWKDFPLLNEGKDENGKNIDFAALKDPKNAILIDYGYDITKPDDKITQADLKNVAAKHAGKFLGSFDGDMYKKQLWQTQDGEEFSASAFTVLRAGHWYSSIYKENTWDFDRLAKNDQIFAQVWLDSHKADECNLYRFDEEFNAIREENR